MGLQAAIEDVQATVGALTGIREAPDEAPEQISVFPYVVTFPASGSWLQEPALCKKGLHTIACQLHIARKDLPRDIQKAMAYCETIPNALMLDPTLGGTVDTIVGEITYTFGELGWGGTDTLGFDFRITVKIQSAIS